ncbi:MAG: hypothetical protein EOP13_26210, partial [Pseudomonas sp.]|uniref:cbb3-type cytochrome c oxidase subunit I n=1 Tax=Pseudomonas sp. TaxID=306 RepID=UPI00121016B4
LAFSPQVGVDYYLWALQIAGVGTLLSGINLTTTILKLRARGMGYSRMPIFCWTALASNLLIIAAFPILTATFAMLLLDRYLGFHFFTNELGGNAMMYVNLIWAWGHPEVYILILPAFGVFSEVIATFSGKPVFGYRSMAIATMAICMLSFMVWLHHFFTMGASADVNGFFGVMTMVIAVPTGVKIFNWLFTLYGGTIRFSVPLLWSLGFMVTFVIGGMTGVLLAIPPVDFVLHNSLFLVAHFHNVIIGGVLFGAFAGYNHWFPKAFGFTLHEGWGKAAFWCWIVGFYLAFMPLYLLGLMGATRRMQHYADTGWQPLMVVALAGAVVILAGIACTVVQLVVSIRTRDRRRDTTGDPWNGRTLEWSVASPPPAWNFGTPVEVRGRDAFWTAKNGQEPEVVDDSFATTAAAAPTPSRLAHRLAGDRGRRGHRGDAAAVLVARPRRDHGRARGPRQGGAGSRAGAWSRGMSGAATTASAPRSEVPRSERGPAPPRVVVTYGFWLFLLSDIVMFAAFFAAYAVLRNHVADGPAGRALFDRDKVLIETGCLLLSSYTCALFSLAIDRKAKAVSCVMGVLTLGLGAAFLVLEMSEFASMLAAGAGPQRSAFLSAFFALVGLHGVHVGLGMAWLVVLLLQIATLGFTPRMIRRLLCFSLFWHALDIVWIGVFTIVYLGAFS